MKCTLNIDLTGLPLEEIARIFYALKGCENTAEKTEKEPEMPLFCDGTEHDAEQDEYPLDAETVARLLGTSASTVYAWRANGINGTEYTLEQYAERGITEENPAVGAAYIKSCLDIRHVRYDRHLAEKAERAGLLTSITQGVAKHAHRYARRDADAFIAKMTRRKN